MDNYGNRGNGSKYGSGKSQAKTYRTGRAVSLKSISGDFCIISLTFLLILLQHDDEMQSERDRNDDYYAKSSKNKDPYYQDYKPKQQQQNPGSKSDKSHYDRSYDNRQSRQGSEPRANNNFSNQDSMKSSSFVNSDRNRDTRSSEPGGGGSNHYEHRNKPPSGQGRLNNAAFQRLPPNIDNLPPRLKKKFLKEAGLPEDLANKPIMELSQQSYSNTLPTGRGGRNNRYEQSGYHHQNYQPKYNNNNNNNNQGYHNDHDSNYHHRSLTPPLSKRREQPQKPPPPRYNDWKANDVPRREDSSPSGSKAPKDDQNFDWSEEVLNCQSLPHEVNSTPTMHGGKYEDSSRRHRRRRNRR